MSTTAFDLISRPMDIQPPWGFLALFWVVGMLLIVLATASWRFRWRRGRWQLSFFSVFWCCLVSYASWTEINLANAARVAAINGNFLSIDGCLSTFHPGKPYASKTIDADEVWTIGGETFEYGAGGVGFAWRRVEPLGGAIHADSHVDVAFVRNEAYGRNEILRLVVQQKACPRAPDPGFP